MLTSTLCPVEAVFTQTALLARLSRAERRRLASHATVRSFAAGTTIVREGDTSMAVYVILYGKKAAVPDPQKGMPIVAYEKVGVGGKRLVARSTTQVEEVDDAKLREWVPNP